MGFAEIDHDDTSAMSTFTFPLHGRNWEKEPVAGDLVIFLVESPLYVIGPAGWTVMNDVPLAVWRIIDTRDPDPVFTARRPISEWKIRAFSVEHGEIP